MSASSVTGDIIKIKHIHLVLALLQMFQIANMLL